MVNKQRLKGRRIVVTGATGGIGGAACERLRAEGARVLGVDARPGDGVLEADVSDAVQVRGAMAAAVQQLGGIDTLVNSAGIGAPQDAGDFPDDEARRVVDVNFFGAWNATAAAMPFLLAGRGQVVNVLSELAVVHFPFTAAYAASKCALEAYSNVLRMEYASRLAVSEVYPGYVRTPIHTRAIEQGVPLEGIARVETVEQAAEAILRVCIRRSRRATLTRQSALELWVARHWPRIAEASVRSRARSAQADRPRPAFVRYPEAPGE